ncbi:Eco57I restriction-modification methylase domain-containing protein [Porphyromonas macacae]|uniref:Eco57I restriction-modification methylase domain-containing protein n=1 Tax=Porphyromonas macacae TaxID=28115 RepID=UPI003D15EBB5
MDDVFNSPSGRNGFDIVIGNPPYAQIPKKIVSASQYPYSEGKDLGKQNLYKVFIELAYNLMAKDAIGALIVQSSILWN